MYVWLDKSRTFAVFLGEVDFFEELQIFPDINLKA